jgi:hypothetical protein
VSDAPFSWVLLGSLLPLLPRQVLFTPGGWTSAPQIALETDVAGETGGASITFTPYNPVPADGVLVVEFPSSFVSVLPTAAVSADLDGLLAVAVSGHVVTITRDGL